MEKSADVEDPAVEEYDTEFDRRQRCDRNHGNDPRVLGPVLVYRYLGSWVGSRTLTLGPSFHDRIKAPVTGSIVELPPKRSLFVPG